LQLGWKEVSNFIEEKLANETEAEKSRRVQLSQELVSNFLVTTIFSHFAFFSFFLFLWILSNLLFPSLSAG
jgi:hypothetical protein